jgi:plasmid maintenance system antidote protein VapI
MILFWNGAVSPLICRCGWHVFFESTKQFWLNLQDAYDLSEVKNEQAQGLKTIEPLATSAAQD